VVVPTKKCEKYSYMNNDQIENDEQFDITYGSNLKVGYINIFKLTKYEGTPERIEDHFELITTYKRPAGVDPISNPDGSIPSKTPDEIRDRDDAKIEGADLTWLIILLLLFCLACIGFAIYKALLRKKRKVKKLPKLDAFTEEAIDEVTENEKQEGLLHQKTQHYGLNDSTVDDSRYIETRESADSLPRNQSIFTDSDVKYKDDAET
jgi:hypothetical protein